MTLYLAAVSTMEQYFRSGEICAENVSVLASFYGISDFEKEYVHKFKNTIIDSGAFTFMRGTAKANWDKYVEEYADFVNKYDIKLFFELDIDPIVGLEEVERLRAKLERMTGKKPIPVWHVNLEAGYKGGAMVKLFHEQKFWEAPAYIHAEYQSTFDGSHTAIAGGTWSFGLPNGFISLSPLYRYDFGPNTHAVQLSNCYLAAWKWCELYGYNHAWYNGRFCFFGEERFHIKITKNLMIGAILDITHFGEWSASISAGLRYDL